MHLQSPFVVVAPMFDWEILPLLARVDAVGTTSSRYPLKVVSDLLDRKCQKFIHSEKVTDNQRTTTATIGVT